MAWHLVGILSGMIAGFVLGVLIDRDTVIRYVVRKIKIKNSENVSDVVTIDDLKKEIKTQRRKTRRERRANRKNNRGIIRG